MKAVSYRVKHRNLVDYQFTMYEEFLDRLTLKWVPNTTHKIYVHSLSFEQALEKAADKLDIDNLH